MAFFYTIDAVRQRRKTVTRRGGWRFLKAGDQLQPVVKRQGLPRGGKVVRIGPPITVVSVDRVPLQDVTDEDVEREGFALSRKAFIEMYCDINRGATPGSMVTRIEFAYPPEGRR